MFVVIWEVLYFPIVTILMVLQYHLFRGDASLDCVYVF